MISQKKKALWISEPVEQGIGENDWVEYQPVISSVLAPVTKRDGTTSSSLVCSDDELPDGSNITIRQNGTVYQGIANITATSQYVDGYNIGLVENSSYDNVSVSTSITTIRDITFKPDGTKMYTCAKATDTLNQYTLSTPWDITTATLGTSYTDATLNNDAASVGFKPDGTKMYVMIINMGIVYQYGLSTAWDSSTASYEAQYDTAIGVDDFPSLIFKPDGTKMYIFSDQGVGYQYTLSTPWVVASASYDNVTVNLDSIRYGFYFSPDGKNLYGVDTGTNTADDYVGQFTLSTAWDLSTVTTNVPMSTFVVGSQHTNPSAVAFKDDMSKMYVVGQTSDTVTQYTYPGSAVYKTENTVDLTNFQLSSVPQYVFNGLPEMKVCLEDTTLRCVSRDTPMHITGTAVDQVQVVYSDVLDQILTTDDLVTVDSGDIAVTSVADSGTTNSVPTYNTVNFSITQDSDPTSMAFSDDGSKMYVLGNASNRVYQYTLSTPFVVNTATYDTVSFGVGGEEANAFGLYFSPNGKSMYIIGYASDAVQQYTLATAWDISSVVHYGSLSVAAQDTSPYDLTFNRSGDRLFVLGDTNNTIYQYDLTTPFDVTTGSYSNNSFSVGVQDTSPRGISFNDNGDLLFVVGESTDIVYLYTLATLFDVSSASYSGTSFSVSAQSSIPSSITFNTSGTTMYVLDRNVDVMYQYSLSAPYSFGGDTIWNVNLPLSGTTPTFIHIKDRSVLIPYNRSLVAGDVYSYTASVSTGGSLSHTFPSTNILPDTARAVQLSVIGDKGTSVSNLTANLWKAA